MLRPEVFVVPQTHDMVSALWSPKQPKKLVRRARARRARIAHKPPIHLASEDVKDGLDAYIPLLESWL